jgi:hypothetical protein
MWIIFRQNWKSIKTVHFCRHPKVISFLREPVHGLFTWKKLASLSSIAVAPSVRCPPVAWTSAYNLVRCLAAGNYPSAISPPVADARAPIPILQTTQEEWINVSFDSATCDSLWLILMNIQIAQHRGDDSGYAACSLDLNGIWSAGHGRSRPC